MTRKSPIAAKLDKLAEKILDATLDGDVSLDQRVDVLKVVGAYHLGIARQSAKQPLTDEDGPTFAEWSKRVKHSGSRADA